MPNKNSEMFKVYKLGKSIKGIGSWMLWGNILLPIFMVVAISVGIVYIILSIPSITSSISTSSPSSILSSIGPTLMIIFYLIGGFGIGIVVFKILTVIYTIMMIVRGFTTASATGIKKYMVFSILYIISYVVTIIMISVLFYYIYINVSAVIGSVQSIISNPSSELSDPTTLIQNLSDSISNLFYENYIYIAIGGIFAGAILRIIAWGFLKGAIKRTSNYGMVQRASSRCTLMMVSLIAICAINLVIFISIVYTSYMGMSLFDLGNIENMIQNGNLMSLSPTDIFGSMSFLIIIISALSLPYFIFYILEVVAFRSIGKRLKTGYSDAGGLGFQSQTNEPTLSSHPNQYSSSYGNSSYGNSSYGNSSYGNSSYGNSSYGNQNRQSQYSSQQGYQNRQSQYSPQLTNSSGAKPTNGSIYCSECGSPNSKTDRICKFCGKPLQK